MKAIQMRSWLFGVTCLSTGLLWIAACSSNSSPSNNNGTSGTSTGGTSGTSSGSSGSATSGQSKITDAGADAGPSGLLVDNMSVVQTGTKTQLKVPSGESAGSYYTYSDSDNEVSNYAGVSSLITGTTQLYDALFTPPVTAPDGTTIQGDICFGGRVVEYAGLGMTLAYGNAPDAAPESGISSPVPFDASRYSGVSFYVLVTPPDSGASVDLRFGIPDTQTADKAAWPAAACDIDGGVCDDDFGSDISSSVTLGAWSKVSLLWTDLSPLGFGSPTFTAIRSNQLIGMKWQANGDGIDAGVDSFNVCISNIYFTP